MYKVELSIGGNPDHGELGGLRVRSAAYVASIDDCSAAVRDFIEEHNLGAGNWYGGDVWKNNVYVGRISYNGRFWPVESKYGR